MTEQTNGVQAPNPKQVVPNIPGMKVPPPTITKEFKTIKREG